jgi:hypothetical protein
MSCLYVCLCDVKPRTKPSIYVLKHMIILLKHPTVPRSGWAKVRQKLSHMKRDVVIWYELVRQEELTKFTEVY